MSFGLGKPGDRTPRRPSELLEERGRELRVELGFDSILPKPTPHRF